jgi:hypothetical protein
MTQDGRARIPEPVGQHFLQGDTHAALANVVQPRST